MGETVPGADTPTDTTARTDPSRCERDAYRLYADIVSLARETASKSHYLQEVLRVVTRFFASPYAALHVRYAAEVFQDDYHTGPTDPKFWKASLQDFLTDALGKRRPMVKMLRSKTGETRVAFISAPIFDERGSTVGALALVLAPVDQEELVGRLSTLEAVTGLTSACSADLGGPQPADASADNRTGASDTRAYAAALARAGSAATPEELAFAITNELRK